jgi:hypothetical protein
MSLGGLPARANSSKERVKSDFLLISQQLGLLDVQVTGHADFGGWFVVRSDYFSGSNQQDRTHSARRRAASAPNAPKPIKAGSMLKGLHVVHCTTGVEEAISCPDPNRFMDMALATACARLAAVSLRRIF